MININRKKKNITRQRTRNRQRKRTRKRQRKRQRKRTIKRKRKTDIHIIALSSIPPPPTSLSLVRWFYRYRCVCIHHMSAERNDQTKKVNNRSRPPETNVVSGRVEKTYFGQNLAPIQRIFDLTDGKCSGRHAGHDLGVENIQIGPKRPYLPRFVF